MQLYITPTSPYARIVRIVILEKGLADQVETIVARTRLADSPYYRINPSGRVPFLVLDDGGSFEDSALISAYLDQLDDAPVFDPPPGRAGWELRRLEALARSMLDGLAVWVRELYRPEGERSPTIIAHEIERSRRMADLWEVEVANPLMGGALNMAQITLITACQMEGRNPAFRWRLGRPNLAAWADRLAERPAVAATAPPFD